MVFCGSFVEGGRFLTFQLILYARYQKTENTKDFKTSESSNTDIQTSDGSSLTTIVIIKMKEKGNERL